MFKTTVWEYNTNLSIHPAPLALSVLVLVLLVLAVLISISAAPVLTLPVPAVQAQALIKSKVLDVLYLKCSPSQAGQMYFSQAKFETVLTLTVIP